MPKLRVINKLTGKLEEHDVEQADRLVAEDGNFDYPSREELERGGRLEKFGGQQGTAALETVARTATFGAWQGFGNQADIEGRRKTLQEESPGVAFGAQAVGATLPAIATGGIAEGVIGAAGLGARAATAASVIGEGAAGGLADEVEQAAIDQRPVSAGRAMLVGIGGEIVGRAIPAAIKAGMGRLRAPAQAAQAVAGEVVTDASEAIGKKARAKVSTEAYDMPPGPERDAALAQTAPDQIKRADAEMADAGGKAQELLSKLADDAPKALAREIDGTAPSQLQWSADVAVELRGLANGASEAEATALHQAADGILEAKTGREIWTAAADARKQLADAHAKAPPAIDQVADEVSGVREIPGAGAKPLPIRDYLKRGKAVNETLSPEGEEAIKSYAGNGYRSMNRRLRGTGEFSAEDGAHWDKTNANLASEIRRQAEAGNAVQGTVYRQMNGADLPSDLKPGDIWSDQGFLSTSQNPLQARSLEASQFGEGVKIQVQSKTGMPMLHRGAGGKLNATREVLFAPGTKLRYLGEGEADAADYFVGGNPFAEKSKVLRFEEVEPTAAAADAGGDFPSLLKASGFGGIDDFAPGELDAAMRPLFPNATAEDMRNLVGGGIVKTTSKPGISVMSDGVLTMAPLEGGGTIKRMFYVEPKTGNKTVAHLEFYLEGNRGKGLGKKILDKQIETYRKAGFDKIILDAEGGSEKVWSRYGFKPVGKGGRMEMVLDKAVANDVGSAGIKRNAKGARILAETPKAGGAAPDFSEWDPGDFAKGRGGSKAAGKHAEDYSGGTSLSTYQRKIVDGIKQDAGFGSTGRVSGDAGNLGSEPTFHVQPDGTVKLTHGRLRITAARELGRDTVHGKVVTGNAKSPTVVYEGQVKVGAGGPRGAPEAAPTAKPPVASPLSKAEQLIGDRQKDVGTWGRAAEGAADLDRSASPGPSSEDRVSALEDQLAAAKRWQAGTEETHAKLAEQVTRLRGAADLRSETERAVASTKATKPEPASKGGFGRKMAQEGAEFLLERAVGHGIPGAGLAIKTLWGALGAQGQAQIKRAARTLLSPLTSQARAFAAPRATLAMTALERFRGDSPDARAAYNARRDLLTQVAGSPQVAGEAMASAMGGLARENPSNFVALAQRMTESLQYVATNLPPTVAVSLAYPTGIPITDAELRDVADLWNTAFEPDTAVDAIASREASPVQMRTLKELHPDIYGELQREIIVQSPDTFGQLDSQTKLSIDIMFGSDGVGGLFATSEAARYVAEAHKRAAQKPEPAPGLQPQDQSGTVEAAGIQAVRTGVTNKGTV